jgi:hypothetical protein
MFVSVGMLSLFSSSWFWQGMNHFALSTTRLLCVVSNYFASSHITAARQLCGVGVELCRFNTTDGGGC